MDSTDVGPRVDGVRVAVRVRPLNEREKSNALSSAFDWRITGSNITQTVSGRPAANSSYEFDRVFDKTADNATVFENLARPVVHAALDGYNATIFAYGQTSSGKTHSMLGTDSDPGVTRRSIQEVFEYVQRNEDRQFLLRASYIEIYQEIIRDLLEPSHDNLKIHEDLNRRVYVDAREQVVGSVDEVMQMISDGESVRAVGETQMNERSSRSHTIFTLLIESRARRAEAEVEDAEQALNEGIAVRASTLSLVDLAGSERAALTGAEGVRLKEGSHINKSLLTLGTVINKLSSAEPGITAHVPYRDSKLTRILQPALGGNARTAILCAVTPAAMHVEETLSTLKFASRAKKVKNKTQCNEFLDDTAKLRRCEREIEKLKKMLANAGQRSSASDGGSLVGDHPEATASRIKAFEEKFALMCRLTTEGSPNRRPSSGTRPSRIVTPRRLRASGASPADAQPKGSDWKPAYTSSPSTAGAMSPPTPTRLSFTPRNEGVDIDHDGRPRDALNLFSCPVPSSARLARSDGGRRSLLVERGRLGSVASESAETEIATLRKAVFAAEHSRKKMQAEIACERKALAAEVDALADAAEEANKMRETAEEECEQAFGALATSHAQSIVDELVSSAMLLSETEQAVSSAEARIKDLPRLEAEASNLGERLAATERELSEALKREKRGVGPVLKEVSALKNKLTESENRWKSTRQTVSKLQTEKAAMERQAVAKDRQIKTIESELQRHRKHDNMIQARADRELEQEQKRHAETEAEHVQLRQKLEADLSESGRALRESMATLEKTQNQAQMLESRNAELEKTLQESNERAKVSQADAEKARGEATSFHTALESAREEQSRSQAALDALSERHMACQASLEEAHADVLRLREEATASTAALEETKIANDTLSVSLEETKAQLEEKASCEANALHQVARVEKELASSQERGSELETRAVGLQDALSAAEEKAGTLEEKLRACTRDLEHAQQSAAKAHEALAEQNGKLEEKLARATKDTELANAQKRSTAKMLEHVSGESEKLSAKLSSTMAALQASKDSVTDAVAEAETAKAEVSRLSAILEEKEQQIKDTEESAMSKCNALSLQVEELQGIEKRARAGLRTQRDAVKEVRLALESDNERLEAALKVEKKARAKEAATSSALLEKVYSRDTRVTELENKLREYRMGGGAIQRLEMKLERRDRALNEQKKALEAQEALLSSKGLREEWLAAERVARLEAEVEGLRGVLGAREARVAELEQREVAGIEERQKLRNEIKARELAGVKARSVALSEVAGAPKTDKRVLATREENSNSP